VKLEPLAGPSLAELEDLYRELGLGMPSENLEQFSRPRTEGGIEVATLLMRDEGRVVGTIGWIEAPLSVPGLEGPLRARWPINLYLLPRYRGRRLGVELMRAAMSGAPLCLVIGGNAASIPVLEKTGWRLLGNLASYRWAFPCLSPGSIKDRFRKSGRTRPPSIVRIPSHRTRLAARRVDRMEGLLPWVAKAPADEAGVVRDESYLRFAFGGDLKAYHSLHEVTVDEALVGYFVLAARAERLPLLTTQIVDLDAVPGREAAVLDAARKTAMTCGDIVRLRLCGERFVSVMAEQARYRSARGDLELRAHASGDLLESLPSGGAWRLSYGDHDQYRVRPTSQVFGPPFATDLDLR